MHVNLRTFRDKVLRTTINTYRVMYPATECRINK